MRKYNCLYLTNGKKTNIVNAIKKNKRIDFIQQLFLFDNVEELVLIHNPNIVLIDIDDNLTSIVKTINEFLAIKQDIMFVVIENKKEVLSSNDSIFLNNISFVSSINNVQKAVSDAIDKLDVNNEKEFSNKALAELENEYIPILRQHYLSKLIRSQSINVNDVKKKFRSLKIDLNGPYFCILNGEIHTKKNFDDLEALNFVLRTEIKNFLINNKFECYIFFDSLFRINCLISFKNKTKLDNIEVLISTIIDKFNNTNNISIHIGIGRIVSSVEDIYVSFKESEISRKYAKFTNNQLVLFSNISNYLDDYLCSEDDSDELIERCIFLGLCNEKIEFEEMENYVDSVLDINIIKRFAIKYLFKIIVSGSDLYNRHEDLSTILNYSSRISLANSSVKIKEYLKEISYRAFKSDSILKTQEELIIDEAIRIININISNPSLDLELVSRELGISRAYFCRIFHKVTNCGFNEYVKKERIELSKILLMNKERKIQDVAKNVGFISHKYFSYVFKQMTNMTPSEYTKNTK